MADAAKVAVVGGAPLDAAWPQPLTSAATQRVGVSLTSLIQRLDASLSERPVAGLWELHERSHAVTWLVGPAAPSPPASTQRRARRRRPRRRPPGPWGGGRTPSGA